MAETLNQFIQQTLRAYFARCSQSGWGGKDTKRDHNV